MGLGGGKYPTYYPFGPVGLPLAPSDRPRARHPPPLGGPPGCGPGTQSDSGLTWLQEPWVGGRREASPDVCVCVVVSAFT